MRDAMFSSHTSLGAAYSAQQQAKRAQDTTYAEARLFHWALRLQEAGHAHLLRNMRPFQKTTAMFLEGDHNAREYSLSEGEFARRALFLALSRRRPELIDELRRAEARHRTALGAYALRSQEFKRRIVRQIKRRYPRLMRRILNRYGGLDEIRIKYSPVAIHLFYGGHGDGSGHAHCVFDGASFKMTYLRNSLAPRGVHNYR